MFIVGLDTSIVIVCQGQQYGYMSDIWALGCILYEMVMVRPRRPHIVCAFLFLKKLSNPAAACVQMKLPFCKAKHVLWGVFSPPNAANDELNTLIKHILIVRSKDRPDATALLQHPAVVVLRLRLPRFVGGLGLWLRAWVGLVRAPSPLFAVG